MPVAPTKAATATLAMGSAASTKVTTAASLALTNVAAMMEFADQVTIAVLPFMVKIHYV